MTATPTVSTEPISAPVLPRASAPPALHETVLQARSGWVAIDWREVIEHRELLYFLVLRDVKVRYKQTVLGVAWAVLQPLLPMIIFTLVFGRLANLPSDGLPYPVFVLAGLVAWTFFANAVSQGSMSLLSQQALLTKIYLPRMFIPAASIGSGLVDILVSLAVMAVVMAVYGTAPGWGVLMLPPLIVITTVGTLGVTLTLAALTVSYRDLRFVVPFLMQVWLYASPVVYSISSLSESKRALLAINPMVGIIDGFRSALLGKPWDWTVLGISSVVALLSLLFGLFFFRRTERRFADIA